MTVLTIVGGMETNRIDYNSQLTSSEVFNRAYERELTCWFDPTSPDAIEQAVIVGTVSAEEFEKGNITLYATARECAAAYGHILDDDSTEEDAHKLMNNQYVWLAPVTGGFIALDYV